MITCNYKIIYIQFTLAEATVKFYHVKEWATQTWGSFYTNLEAMVCTSIVQLNELIPRVTQMNRSTLVTIQKSRNT